MLETIWKKHYTQKWSDKIWHGKNYPYKNIYNPTNDYPIDNLSWITYNDFISYINQLSQRPMLETIWKKYYAQKWSDKIWYGQNYLYKNIYNPTNDYPIDAFN